MPRHLAVPHISVMVLSCTLLFSGSALAADISVKAPVPVAPYSWTGFYVGAHVGAGWSDTDWVHEHCNCPGGANMGEPGQFLTTATGNAFLGGAQAGYDHQYAPNWLIGFEGQLSWTGIDGEGAWTGNNGDPHTASFNVNWVATFGPRLGYIFDRGLVYIKGGVALANIDYDHTHLMQADSTLHAVSGSNTKTGWSIGGGIEHVVWRQFTAKVEYNFIDLGSKNVTLTKCCTFNVDQQIHVVKAGINYRFGAPAAMGARY